MNADTSNSTVVLGDLCKSTSCKISSIIKLLELIDINLSTQNAQYSNTWGDAFVIVFDTADKALLFALKVRDNLRLYDWRKKGLRNAPLLRIALTSGQLNWSSYEEIKTPEGMPLVEVARMEPITTPGDVYVTNIVRELAKKDLFYFQDIGTHLLPKNYGTFNLFRAFWAIEREPGAEHLGPLLDDQYYRRAEALRRFSFLWLTLDQLPIGSWGRSIPSWMSEVWRDDPGIMTTPLMEDEGGFETTILNLELLSRIIGQEAIMTNSGWRAIEYLQKRYTPKGFGTLGFTRQGYTIEPHPRHTSLVAWLLSTIYKDKTVQIPDLRELFINSVRSLFSGSPSAVAKEFEEDRNPLILYLASWHVIKQIQSVEFSKLFTTDEHERILDAWRIAEITLLNKAQRLTYENGRPEALAKNRRQIYPLTIPYGEFIRMETYSILSAAILTDSEMPKELLDRLGQGIIFIVDEYLNDYGNPQQRYNKDPLRPTLCGPKPYYAEDKNIKPDIGTAAMLLRVLRSNHIINALWGGTLPEKAIKARYLLSEDLVQIFDRYLCEPKLYSFTHPGMLAGVMVGDDQVLLKNIVMSCQEISKNLPPVILKDPTIDEILSEEMIEKLIETIVAKDEIPQGIQLATYSLTRLLVDKLRPGRYVKEKLSNEGIKITSQKTLGVYTKPAFAEKYNTTWGYVPDLAIIAPFLRFVGKKANILDIGCGPGQYAAELTKEGHNVTLLDASSPMLDIASERLQRITNSNPVKMKCDVLDPISRAHFTKVNAYDAIWCSGLFAHIPKAEQPEILKWIYSLLRPEGYLFINIMLDNPRIFARDGRYYGYISDPRDFETILYKCNFRSDYILQTKVERNTYGEPFLETVWANYYAQKIIYGETNHMTLDEGNKACMLTSLAYARSVEDYRKSHKVEQDNSHRLKIIDGYLEKTYSFLKDEVEKPCVLDAGCGPGDYVTQMALRGWEAVGIDISDQTIQSARNNCNPEVGDRASFSICDMRSLPSGWTERFDAILCITAFQHIPIEGGHANLVLGEFLRVLRPGGILRIDVQLGRESGYDPDLRFIQGYESPSDIRVLLEKNNFTIINTNEWELPPGKNTYKRPISFKFLELWCKETK